MRHAHAASSPVARRLRTPVLALVAGLGAVLQGPGGVPVPQSTSAAASLSHAGVAGPTAVHPAPGLPSLAGLTATSPSGAAALDFARAALGRSGRRSRSLRAPPTAPF